MGLLLKTTHSYLLMSVSTHAINFRGSSHMSELFSQIVRDNKTFGRNSKKVHVKNLFSVRIKFFIFAK